MSNDIWKLDKIKREKYYFAAAVLPASVFIIVVMNTVNASDRLVVLALEVHPSIVAVNITRPTTLTPD